MNSGRLQLVLKYAVALVVIASIAAFASHKVNSSLNIIVSDELSNRASNPYNKQLVDSGISLLKTGDLVIRMGADMTSYMFSQMNQTDKNYSHCGLVVVEDGQPFVYHSIGGEDNPDQVLRRDSASFWFSPSNNLGFGIARLAIDTQEVQSVTSIVYKLYKEKRKFDMDFDLNTDDRLYCAEFVYKTLNQAMRDSEFIKPCTVFGYTFVGIDNLFLNSHAQLICQLRFK